jgi:choline dehydrogenase
VWFHVPVGYLYCIGNKRADWCFETVKEKGLNGRSLIYPRGFGLGGCSLINGMIYMRGQKEDYDGWAASTGDPSWGWQSMLEMFKKHERYHGAASEHHSTSGVWPVEKQRLRWDVLEVFRASAKQLGIPETADFNRGCNHGIGYFDVNQSKGWRLSSYGAFLQTNWAALKGIAGDMLRRAPSNLTVVSESLVEDLHFDSDGDSSATGTPLCRGVNVVPFSGGEKTLYTCNREVILYAGAIGSVQILERSGIGDPAILTKLGVPLRHSLPGVGSNLQDHLQLRTVFRVHGLATLNTMADSLWGQFKIGLEYVLKRTGPMAMAPSQLGCFSRSESSHATPNVEFHVQPLSLPRFGENLDPFNAFTASVCNLRPTSRGTVHITSTDVRAKPEIAPNYLSTAEDQRVAVDSLRLARKIVSQEAFAKYSPEEVRPGAELVSDEDLIKAAGAVGTTIFHPCGTCKMGPASDPMSVVSNTLNVHGLRGLRVADASIMPTITSGNTANPCMAIAEKCAEMIKNAT